MKIKITAVVIIALFIGGVVHALDMDKDASKPESHRAGWSVGHQSAAKSDSQSCKMCHKSYFCIDCHQRRDTIQERVHRRNFKFYHSIEARANPRKCDSCHRLSFCSDCHQTPK